MLYINQTVDGIAQSAMKTVARNQKSQPDRWRATSLGLWGAALRTSAATWNRNRSGATNGNQWLDTELRRNIAYDNYDMWYVQIVIHELPMLLGFENTKWTWVKMGGHQPQIGPWLLLSTTKFTFLIPYASQGIYSLTYTPRFSELGRSMLHVPQDYLSVLELGGSSITADHHISRHLATSRSESRSESPLSPHWGIVEELGCQLRDDNIKMWT